MNLIFGDSISTKSTASGATSAASSYASLLQSALGVTVDTVAVAGSMAADQAQLIYSYTAQAGDRFIVALGTNDERIYLTDTAKRAAYHQIVQGILSFLGTPTKRNGLDSSIIYTGSWGATAVYGMGKNSYTQGDKATFTVNGTAAYIGLIAQSGAPGVAEIRVDGVLHGTWLTSQNINTSLGATYCPSLYRIGGLSAGDHSVEVKVVSSGGSGARVYLDWIATSTQTIKPDLYVVNVPKAQAYSTGGSDANVALYNAELSTIVNELAADGLHVHLVNICDILNPSLDMDGGYHPVNIGHSKISAALNSAISGNVTYSAASVYLGSDGFYYVGAGSDHKRLMVT